MIEPKPFQSTASSAIANSVVAYALNPQYLGAEGKQRVIPFFQILSSITASGKTIILAKAISDIANALAVKPVILWLSKGKVVVEQTYENLQIGGKYHSLIDGYQFRALAELNTEELSQSAAPFVYFATVGTFNQKDGAGGKLLIYKSDLDTTESSVWAALKQRPYRRGLQRPLVIVYDEGHNLTSQQTDILCGLRPAAFILASATMRLPPRLSQDLALLKNTGYSDKDFVTQVDAKAVVLAELVKTTVMLDGYKTSMEVAIDGLLARLAAIEADAHREGVPIQPKAIYVSNTNIVDGDAHRQDDIRRPFHQREAPPILIWRHLTETRGIDPADIAVYCSLKFSQAYPPPRSFNLFKGADKDYREFKSGNFRHIIFNLSLQEGWDDPECYLAYIDKSMQSPVQVEQIIGRLLRQPMAKHYASELLNSASLFVRVDKGSVFADVRDAVNRKLQAEFPDIKVMAGTTEKERPVEYPVKTAAAIPGVALGTGEAAKLIARELASLNDYSSDSVNTRGAGGHSRISLFVGDGNIPEDAWEDVEEASKVRARWIFDREVRQRYPGALGAADTSSAKFDARIGLGSSAEKHITDVAEKVVDIFLNNVNIRQKASDPVILGPALCRPSEIEIFKNAVHEGYSGLNPDELQFAKALDASNRSWARNPSQTGFKIPLPSRGLSMNFFPDFIVWDGPNIHLIDPKGGHLIGEAAARKLLNIRAPETTDTTVARLRVWLLSRGTWRVEGMIPKLVQKAGITLWSLGDDGSKRAKPFDDFASVVGSILDHV